MESLGDGRADEAMKKENKQINVGDRVVLVDGVTKTTLEFMAIYQAGKVLRVLSKAGGIGATVTSITELGLCYLEGVKAVIPIEYLEVMKQ